MKTPKSININNNNNKPRTERQQEEEETRSVKRDGVKQNHPKQESTTEKKTQRNRAKNRDFSFRYVSGVSGKLRNTTGARGKRTSTSSSVCVATN